jgi:hypothetical protein
VEQKWQIASNILGRNQKAALARAKKLFQPVLDSIKKIMKLLV